ncbi:TIR domain-containing protein [Streptomyces sp. NBRC 110611]|uniref:WD40 repeat domain-containing protein n=1 Tax=Streptomyces sp. NBRC 110611 TaxID=1621259 RepID=UPI0015EF2175
MEASPDLWATIEAKLSASRHLVLLASPQAARSPWVGREIAHWKQHRAPATLLIVLTGGAIHWDDTARDFDRTRTTALPPEVFGWFAAEPLWVDLTWARSETELTLEHARFRQDIGTLAAALHGVSKDELDSEDARQHARTVGVRRGLTWSLAFFLVASLVFGVMAQVRGDEAERQRKEADGQRRVATMRALLAESKNRLADDPRTAIRLGLTAHSVHPTTETRAALVDALRRTPYAGASNGPDHAGQFIRRLSGDAGVLATAGEGTRGEGTKGEGTLKLWDVSQPGRRRLLHRLAPPRGDVKDIAFSPDGRTLISSHARTVVWRIRPSRAPQLLSTLRGHRDAVTAAAFRPDGKAAITLDEHGSAMRWDLARPDKCDVDR